MKKTFVILSAMLALLSCAKIAETEIEKEPKEDEAIVSNPVTFNITVADMETKAASKDAWTNGDKIYVVFKGLTTKYLLLTYDSGTDTWGETPSTAFDESDFSGLAEKKITSVFFPVDVTPALSAGVLSFTDGSSNPVYTYYLKEEEKAYTVDGTTVNLNISLAIAGNYAQFHIPGIQANVGKYRFSANGVQPVACSSIAASDASITETSGADEDPFSGFADADGGVFSARIVDPGNSHAYSFNLSNPTSVYTFSKERVLNGGKFYKFPALDDSKWVKTYDGPATPLTFEAKTAGATVTLRKYGSPTAISVEYSTDGSTWNTYTVGTTGAITLINVGDKVMFRGTNSTLASDYSKYHYFSLSGDCYVYGNVMSLLSASGYASATSLSNSYCFCFLFYNCSTLYNHPNKAIALSATTLASFCYYSMFYGCTSLTTAPDLPATTLASYCYASMFRDCTGLTTAPTILPATTLVDHCYNSMFYGCSELTTAPILPATTLQSSCYIWMFYGCTKLSSVTCLATSISAETCVYRWLYGVAATGTFTAANSSVPWTTNSTSGIPSGWTRENLGIIPSKFSVSSTKQVRFSQGNLQYQASTGTWRFATNQYDAIGSGNSNVSPTYSGWIDSFGWGSGNQPTQTSENPSEYSTFVDWGTHAISNGGNTANLWRTLTESEWTYLIFTRPNASSKRGRATVNGMYCFVLLPDDWVLPSGLSFTPDANNWTNVYTVEEWAQMEAAGAVCFPAAGTRAGGTNNTNVNDYNHWGCYWSSTSANSSQGYNLWITSDHVGTTDKGNYQMGASVRLVKNAN